MNQFKKSALVLAMAGATLTVGTVNAQSVIDIAAPPVAPIGGPYVPDALTAVRVEQLLTAGDVALAFAAGTGDVCDPASVIAPRSVVYAPNTAISTNGTITLALANGALAESEFGLPVLVGRYLEEVENPDFGDPLLPDAPETVQVSRYDIMANLVDFESTADGYTELRFQMLHDMVPGDGYYLGIGDGEGDYTLDLTFVAKAGSSPVTVEVSAARDPSSLAIEQGVAGPVDLVDYEAVAYGFAATPATSVIDVQNVPSREFFVDEGDGVTTSVGAFTVSRIEGTVECKADLSKADFTFAVGSDAPKFNDVSVALDLGGTAALPEAIPVLANADTTDNENDYKFDSSGIGVIETANDLVPGSHLVSIATVEDGGAEVLRVGDWSMSLEVSDASDSSFNGFSILSAPMANVTHMWDINGAQAKIPYHAQNVRGFSFFFNVVNESAHSAVVLADVIVDNKTTGESIAITGVEFEKHAEAESSTTFGQQDIKDAINAAAPDTIDDTSVYHVAMTVIVGAQQNSVQVAGFQKDPVGRTVVPVLLNVNNGNEPYGQVWQQ